MSVSLGTNKTKFSAAVDRTGRIYVEGAVRQEVAYLTKIGSYEVDLVMLGAVLLCRCVHG